MRRIRILILALVLPLIVTQFAAAHRPYFTQVEAVILPDGRPGEMRLLRGDGIFLADPGRILVLDAEGRLQARSRHSVTMALLCDRALRSCRGYDGISILTLDPASFRPGEVVPGLADAERDGLWAFEAGNESWGFAIRRPSLAYRLRGELALALSAPRTLVLLAVLGVVAAMLVPGWLLSWRVRTRPSVWALVIGIPLRLVGLASILFIRLYIALLIGFTLIGWLTGFGSGAGVTGLWGLRRAWRATPRRAA